MMQNNKTKDSDACFEEDRSEPEKGIYKGWIKSSGNTAVT
jgi:hypothetical protein